MNILDRWYINRKLLAIGEKYRVYNLKRIFMITVIIHKNRKKNSYKIIKVIIAMIIIHDLNNNYRNWLVAPELQATVYDVAISAASALS